MCIILFCFNQSFHTCVCVCVCVHIYIYIYIFAVHILQSILIYLYVNTYKYIYEYMYVYIWEYANPYKLTYAWWVFSLGFIFYVQKVEKYFHRRDGEWSFTLLKRAENFTAQQKIKKSQFCDRSQRNVPFAIGTKNKPSFQYCPLDFGLKFMHNLVVAKWDLGAHFARASNPTSSLEKV